MECFNVALIIGSSIGTITGQHSVLNDKPRKADVTAKPKLLRKNPHMFCIHFPPLEKVSGAFTAVYIDP